MWSPNSKKPLVEMLAHKSSVLGVAVDQSGTYMATTGLDNRMRFWDLRNYKVHNTEIIVLMKLFRNFMLMPANT